MAHFEVQRILGHPLYFEIVAWYYSRTTVDSTQPLSPAYQPHNRSDLGVGTSLSNQSFSPGIKVRCATGVPGDNGSGLGC